MPRVRPPVAMSEDQRPAVARLEAVLATRKARLVGPDGEGLALPEPICGLLRDALALLGAGRSVALCPHDALLTTRQAALLLNISRQYLVRLLDDRRIPYDIVGTHRRIRFADTIRFKAARDRHRGRTVSRMSRENAALYR